MKAIQITAPEQVQITNLEMPVLQSGEVLVRIRYVGFCGSDLNTFLGKNPMVKLPVIPGHEVGAEIVAVANDVPSHLEPGMAVTLNPYTNCGKCASCRNGRVNACKDNETLGVQRNGSMREFLTIPWQKVIPATGLSVKECALIEPLSVGFHAVDRGQVTDLDIVMVIGCTVIAVDMDDEKLALVRTLGVKYTINSKTENVHERLQTFTQGFGPDVVIEAVGSPVTYVMAVEEVAFTGICQERCYVPDQVVCSEGIGYSRFPKCVTC